MIDCTRFGVNEMLIWDTSDQLDRSLHMMADAGVKWLRINWAWQDIERKPGAWDFTRLDAIAQTAKRYDIQLLPILLTVPEWAHQGNLYSLSAWLNYVQTVVERYRFPYWEVWNEEDLAGTWPPVPSPSEYLILLEPTFNLIKSIDPTIKVVLGGLAQADTDYLRALYTNGGERYFDVVSIHFYTIPAYGILPIMESVNAVRMLMLEYGDKYKPIWLTEIGWSDDSSDEQISIAAFLTDVYTAPIPVDKIFWYNFRNVANAPTPIEANYGLVNSDFAPKPTYVAYQALSKTAPISNLCPTDASAITIKPHQSTG